MVLKTNSPFLTNTQTLKQCNFFFRTSVSRLGQEFPKTFVKNKIFLNLGFTKKKQILESINAFLTQISEIIEYQRKLSE